MRRFAAIATALVLAVAACSGDDAESTPTTDTVATTETESGSKPTTTAPAKATTAAPQTTTPAGDGYTFSTVYAGPDEDGFAWEWIGSFSIDAGSVVGSGTVGGSADGPCGIEGGTEYPVAYTAAGEFDITGTADNSVITVVLRPTDGNVDLTVGDPDQLCVELSVDAANAMVLFPLGDVEVTELPIEVPREGGNTTLDFGDGFVFEVTVTAN